MAAPRGRSAHSRAPSSADDDAIFNRKTRSIETFGRKITATAGHLMGTDASVTQHYQSAMGEIHRELRNPLLQRQIFSFSQASPRELVRAKLSPNEIQHRALTYLPDEMLHNMPESGAAFSLFQGFQATLPELERQKRRRSGRHTSKAQRLLEEHADNPNAPESMKKLRNEKNSIDQRIDMIEIRKNMCSTEIKEIDNKIANLNTMRKIVLDRLADLEQEEMQLERDMLDLESNIEELPEELEDESTTQGQKTPQTEDLEGESKSDSPAMEASFMSEANHSKNSSVTKKPKTSRRKAPYILHEHLQAGSKIRQIQAHEDSITAMDFDVPFGTMVTAALDDTVRVWDLNAGRCIGLLEGHISSVRCLQVEDNLVATGSMDATVRLWDLNQAEYTPPPTARALHRKKRQDAEKAAKEEGEEESDEEDFLDASEDRPPSNMAECPLFTLSAHVAEVTALHFHNNNLVTGSADKTLRQWDLEKGRCIQTLDVLWAAAQAASTSSVNSGSSNLNTLGGNSGPDLTYWKQPSIGRGADSSADFVGALQCFDAALACGTADGMVRLWDLRSGQVHRSLVGHTGPITSLQFDDVHLVTASADRSVRIWDLRTGSIFEAYAYDNPVSSVMFDARSIVAAAGESVVKVYDKTDGRHWDCGMQVGAEGREEDARPSASVVERVRVKDGFMVDGRRDGLVGVWSV